MKFLIVTLLVLVACQQQPPEQQETIIAQVWVCRDGGTSQDWFRIPMHVDPANRRIGQVPTKVLGEGLWWLALNPWADTPFPVLVGPGAVPRQAAPPPPPPGPIPRKEEPRRVPTI